MTPASHRFFAACRARAWQALGAACIGAVGSGFYAVAEWPQGNPAATMFVGTVIGVFIYLFISILELLLGARIERLGRTPRAIGHALKFAIGGVLGGAIGLTVGVNLVGHSMNLMEVFRGRGNFFVIMAAATALIASTGFRAYDLVRDRLAQQIEERMSAEKELEFARTIQTRLLPPQRIDGHGFTVSARNLAARFVAGDFYDVLQLDDGSVVIVVADVAGKGIGAALIMASVKAVLPFVARETPSRAMSMLNAKLVQELARREFVALAYARFTPSDGALELLNAGFPEPYLVSNGNARALQNTGVRLPLGVRAAVDYEPLRATLHHGERLVFLSDGIPEAPVNGEPLGYERVAEMLGATRDLDAFLESVRDAGGTVDDDWTAVVVERT